MSFMTVVVFVRVYEASQNTGERVLYSSWSSGWPQRHILPHIKAYGRYAGGHFK